MNIIFSIIITVFVAFLLDSIIYFYLPEKQIYINQNTKDELEYKKFKIYNAFLPRKVIKKEKKVVIKKEYPFVNNVTLKAIFRINQTNGYILISPKNSSDSIILNVFDEYKGFRLIKLFEKYVIFTKNNKEYKLSLTKDTNNQNFKIKKLSVTQEEGIKIVKRSLIDEYSNNISKVWSNISINEYKKNGKIIGFKIYNIKRGSVFEKLGLKVNDIIIKVNNIRLNSLNSAFRAYKKFKNVSNLNITVLRDNNEVELEYEIR